MVGGGIGGSDDGDCDDGVPRSRNRPPCWSRHLGRRCPRRKVKRSAVGIVSKSFSEIQRIYAIEFDVYE